MTEQPWGELEAFIAELKALRARTEGKSVEAMLFEAGAAWGEAVRDLRDLARLAVDYDEALIARMSEVATSAEGYAELQATRVVESETLDLLYVKLMTRARTILGLPNVLATLEEEDSC